MLTRAEQEWYFTRMSDLRDGADGDSDPTFRLIYRSHSLIPADERRTELGEIFATARRKNKGLGITGALVISGDSFVQALEGDEQAVRDLYATICEDARHDELETLEEVTVGGRTFGRWAMARVDEDGKADIRLVSNAAKKVIVEAKRGDATVTPEQETVLASMRRSLIAQSA